MKFLLSTFGSAGDVYPMVGLALELRSRGHHVTLATNSHFADVAERHGIPFVSFGTTEDYDAAVANPDLWKPRRAFRHIVTCFQPTLRKQFELHRDSDAVGITSCLGFGALLAQEKHGQPLITLHLQPAVLWSDRDPPHLAGMFGPRWMRQIQFRIGERYLLDPVVRDAIGPLRTELGLPPLRRVAQWWHSPRAVVGLFPAWYAPPQPDWPANLTLTDFPMWSDRTDEPLPGDVNDFLAKGDAPLVFTAGTANCHARPFLTAAVEACQRLGRRGILLTRYREQVPEKRPATVAHVPYVPLDRLLPRAAAFIHHGGVGSASQALAAGIPQLVMPLAHDQFDNAMRLERLGVGTSLGVKRFTGDRLARKLKPLLESTAVARACQQIAAKLTARDGLAQAATVIETRAKGA